ncbi:MAG: hypothetical protein ABI691_19220 [Ginsengibacter sp.]
MISSIRYETYYFKIPNNIDTVDLVVALQAGKANAKVMIKAKHSRGWYLWRKIVVHKDRNNIYRYQLIELAAWEVLRFNYNR